MSLESARTPHLEAPGTSPGPDDPRALVEELEAERRRLVLSNELTAALSGAYTRSEVARRIFEKGLAVFGADAGALALLVDGRVGEVELVETFGYPEPLIRGWRRFPLALRSPVTDAIRLCEPIWVESGEVALARYPDWAPAVLDLPDRAWAALPLVVRGRTLGALGFSYYSERRFEPDYRAVILSVAERCAQALDRADLYERALRNAEEARQRAAELQTVLDTVPAAVWIARDPRGDRIDANRLGAALLRRPPGANVSLSGPEQRELSFVVQRDGVTLSPEELPIQKAARSGTEVRDFEEDLVFEDGTVLHLLGNAVPIRDGQGRPTGAVGAFMDVTDRKRMEEELRASQARLSAILDQLPVAVGVLDLDGRFILSNHALGSFVSGGRTPARDPEQQRRWRAEDDQGRPLPADQWPDARALRGEVVSPGLELLHLGEDGSQRRTVVSAVPLRPLDGRLSGAIVVVQDVTAAKRTERALREEERRFRTLFETMSEGFSLGEIILDEAGRPHDLRYLAVNPAFERHTGLRAADILGKTTRELFPGAEPEWFERYGKVVATGEPAHFEARFGPLDKWFEVSAYRTEPGRFAVVLFDVTDRKRAEEALRGSENKLRALADSMPQLAWTARPDGYITWYNRRWYEYTGSTPEQMEGWGWQSVHDPATLPDVLRRWRASIATGDAFEMEFPLRGADGKFRRFLTRGFPLTDDGGRVVQWFGTNTDVTELMEAQNALCETDRQKTDFLAVLSHELRNPLAPIRSGLLVLDRAAPGSETAQRALAVIRRQTDHLARLVDDLLDISRITLGKIDLQLAPLDVRDVARRACDDVRGPSEQRGVQLSYVEADEQVWVTADAARVSQMLGNLLANALKFTPPGGEVIVVVRKRDGACELAVRDTGTGIAPEDIDRIFDRFAQAERTRDRARGGLGIGLALARELATMHGGSVRASSAGIGRGSEFVISLPLTRPPREASTARPRAEGPRLSLLVVEDNEDAGPLLAELLGLDGHEVRLATTGAAALERVRAATPDVLICDVGLPDMNGYEVVERVRQLEGGKGLFAIALTGYAQPQDRERALAAGFDAHLPKPPPVEELQALLAQAAGRRGG